MHKSFAFIILLIVLGKLGKCQSPAFEFLAENQKISTGCAGSTIVFKNISTDTSHSFTWEINGFKLYTTSTFFIFTKEGTYPIKLTDNKTNTSITKTILINPLPTVDFTISQNSICAGNPITFTSLAKGNATIQNYYWNFDDDAVVVNQSSTQYTFNKPGTKKILLFVKDANGCYSPTSDAKQVTINGSGNLTFTTENNTYYSCTNTINFNKNSDNNSSGYLWDFGDGKNYSGTQVSISHTYEKAGTYKVALSSSNPDDSKCATKYMHSVYIGKPNIKINAPEDICTDISFNLNATDTSNNFALKYSELQWQTDNGNFNSDSTTLSYHTPGVYNLNVVNTIGCPSPTSTSIKVNQTPTLSISYNPVGELCNLIPIHFTATTDSDARINWQYGDGNSETSSNGDTITHSYNNANSYKITATTTNSAGCSISNSNTTLTMTNDCIDKGIDIILNPVFKFYSSCDDKYLVTFVNRNPERKFKSITIDETVYSFTTDTIAIRLPYKNKGATYNAFITFADGTNDRVSEITIIDETANFSVVNNDNTSLNCAQNNYTISSATFVDNSNISNYEWAIEDITNNKTIYSINGANLNAINFNFPDVATYKITLTIYDKRENPCVSTISKEIQTQGPVGNFNALTDSIFCLPHGDVVVKNISKVNLSELKSIIWDFGDSSSKEYSATQYPDTVQHSYLYKGNENLTNYSISLRITDKLGCTSLVSKAGIIKLYNPTLNIVPTSPIYCASKTIQINNLSNIADLSTNGFIWTVDNITTSSNTNEPSTYTKKNDIYPEYKSVNIEANYGNGISCKIDSNFVDIIKFIKPQSKFTILDSNLLSTCPPYILHIKNESLGYSNLQWTFSDSINLTSTKDTVLYYVERPDYYSIKLKTDGYDNCYDSTDYKFMSKGPKATLTNTVYLNCTPVITKLTINSNDPIESYLWSFGDSTTLTSADASSVEHTYNRSGNYTPTAAIIGTEESGHCLNNLSLTLPIVVDEKLNLKYKNTYDYCMGDSSLGNLRIEVYSKIGKSFYWSTDPSSIETIKSDRSNTYIDVNPKEATNYYLFAKSANTCPDETATIQVLAHETPITHFPIDELTVAAGQRFYTNPSVQSTSINLKYVWTPNKMISNSLVKNPEFIGDNNLQYTLAVQNTFGCSSKDSINIKVLCSSSKFYIPSAFTPNSDGKNDRFYVNGYGIQKVNHFFIVDRWGKMLFEKNNINSNDYSQGWDGTDSNGLAPAGTYVYFAEVICTEGNTFKLRGTVVLIR